MKTKFEQGVLNTSEQHEVNSIIMEQASEIAGEITERICENKGIKCFIHGEDQTTYTGEAQDIFNRLYDEKMEEFYSFANRIVGAIAETGESPKKHDEISLLYEKKYPNLKGAGLAAVVEAHYNGLTQNVSKLISSEKIDIVLHHFQFSYNGETLEEWIKREIPEQSDSKDKVLITIEGGIVQSVCTSNNAKIVIIDYDDKGDEPVIVSQATGPDVIVRKGETFYEECFTGKLHKSEKIAQEKLREMNF